MFSNLTIKYPAPRLLESPVYATSEAVPINRREQVFREHLRWFLHSQWCVSATHRRKVCNDPRCQQLRPVIYHVKNCKKIPFCDTPYCTISRECLIHYISCRDDDCPKCKLMKYAYLGRFLPNREIFPQPESDYLPIKVRGKIIRRIVRRFYKNLDYTDLQDERLEKEIFRARVIEAISYRDARSTDSYRRFIRKEVRRIRGPRIA
ncbi:hypothetical protein Aperf_G00000096322 [Anoplocephala perfoliata]